MRRLTQQPKWTIMLSLPTVMHNTLMELLQSMIRIPPLKIRGIMNSRLRDNIGLSTSPATGSNVHRSYPLTFGKCLFICGRPVSVAFFKRPVWEQTIGKQSNERPLQKNPAVPDASGKNFRKSVRSSINLLQPSPGVRCAVMQTLGIPRVRITASLRPIAVPVIARLVLG